MNVKLLDLQGQYLSIRGDIRRAIDEICDSQAFILGAAVERFEKKLAAYCGVRHVIGVSSGTDALLCAMMAMGITAGDEVICPAFTFFATAGCVARLGARVVFADINPRTFNLDPKDFASRITPRTKAVIPVHLFGHLADMDAINAVAARHNVRVLEDAAQAIGAGRGPAVRRAGAWGLAGCLSFYPTKNLGGFGDGGAICTDDDELDRVCRLLRVHGSGHQYHHQLIGGAFRLDALQAAVLEVKLKHLESWHEARRAHAALYDRLLAGSAVRTPPAVPGDYDIYNQYCVRVPHRDAVKQRLADNGVGSAIYYPLPLHLQECFASLGYHPGDFPHSERACREVLALPIYPELEEPQIRYVAEQLLAAVS